MTDKIGKLNGNLVWLFALGAVGLGIAGAYITANMGSTVSSAVYFGVFAVAGFAAMLLTRSKTAIGVLAFIMASIASAVIYYFLASSIMAEATNVMTTAVGAKASEAKMVSGVFGTAVGLFAAGFTLLASLISGIGGCIAGARQRRKLVGA